ncbi:LysE family transporter [Pararcticibacter amylolyticus]|uniref:Lysine transporter LysE n=1 Tax=Pararcticibacter amylolyticus TaxID=2173175 RepID=A0A2U2PBK9_9SPHI|nr:LysE family transporter [Pararcticibacter amylolyticus]PWG78684.1 lysine transporter LysE [Pararcticibacter amylolyticus]
MLLLTFLVAVAVNFLGYIPLGNINLTTVQISVNRGLKQALYFTGTFAVMDVLITYILMRFAEWFAGHKNWWHFLDYLLIVVFLVMGYMSWHASTHQKKVEYKAHESIRYGIVLGIFNPMQIPFWMIGGTYLISHGWITTEGAGIELFAIGAGLGAFLCLFLFARFARYIQEKFALSARIINRSIAFVFFTLAAIHVLKLLF